MTKVSGEISDQEIYLVPNRMKTGGSLVEKGDADVIDILTLRQNEDLILQYTIFISRIYKTNVLADKLPGISGIQDNFFKSKGRK